MVLTLFFLLFLQNRDSELTVKAYGPSPENLMLLVHEVFETLILESFKGIAYDFYLPCPDCASMVRQPKVVDEPSELSNN